MRWSRAIARGTQHRRREMRSRAVCGLLGLLASLAVVPSAAAAPAPTPHLYWAGVPGAFQGRIDRVELDGSNLEMGFIRTGTRANTPPIGTAVDGEHVFWWVRRESGAWNVGRARANDGSHEFARLVDMPASSPVPTAMAASGGFIYWANGGLGRAKADGTHVRATFVDPPGGRTIKGVAVDADHLYLAVWDHHAAIARMNLDGSDPDWSFIPKVHAESLSIGGGFLFWLQFSVAKQSLSIARANLDGTGVQLHLLHADRAFSLAASDAGIYWAMETTGLEPVIARADLDGSNADRRFIRHLRAFGLSAG
jgi:hypothetical protein